MNKNDLKNGMKFVLRNGETRYIIEDDIYIKERCKELKFVYSLNNFKEYIKDDMFYGLNNEYDIMKIYDSENNLLWERTEVDWRKIPKDTKVLVRNYDYGGWYKRHFAHYKEGLIYCYDCGADSWVTKNTTAWEYAKLAEEPKDEITAGKLRSLYNNMCEEYHSCCSYCRYKKSRENCEFQWLLDNYNVSPK